MTAPFRFQQFTIHQSRAAFKVGTDSVLLGSWIPPGGYKNVLDLGAGTGILSLMSAQRFDPEKIVALESDEGSVKDCANNFALSPWKEKLSVIHTDLFYWSKENKTRQFDLIITNPPYFRGNLKNQDARKSNARHSNHLLDELPDIIDRHLNETGIFAVVLPNDPFIDLWDWLGKRFIHGQRICDISSYENGKCIRKLGLFSKTVGTEFVKESHFIYNHDKSRSPWYAGITKEFYL